MMLALVLTVLSMSMGPAISGLRGEQSEQGAKKMKHVGETFVFDFPQFTVKVHYISETTMRWEQTRGAAAGSHDEEEYHVVEVCPDVLLLSWQERNTSVVSQVVDFGRGTVYTTYVSPEKEIFRLQGTVRRASN